MNRRFGGNAYILKVEEIPGARISVGRFLQETHDTRSQKTTFFVVTAVKASNPTRNAVHG
jgi:hypothetical protein